LDRLHVGIHYRGWSSREPTAGQGPAGRAQILDQMAQAGFRVDFNKSHEDECPAEACTVLSRWTLIES
jgi:hypothetical protein